MAKEIFRNVAMERLSSPEQLDLLMQVTTPKGWVALFAIASLLVGALLWGTIGSIQTRVVGQGILIKTGGVFGIVANTDGTIKDLYVSPGEAIQKGQIIARVAQPDILDALKEAREKRLDLEEKRDQMTRFGTEEEQLELRSMNQQRANIESTLQTLEGRKRWIEEKIKNEEGLLADGLITKQQYINTKEEMNAIVLEMESKKDEFQRIDIREHQLNSQKEEEASDLKRQIDEAMRAINALQDNLDDSSKVISPFTGRILEVPVDEGYVVERGTTLAKVELLGKEIKTLEGVLYFPASDGKRIKVGMTVQIAPSTVRQSEYGCLLGLVTHVSNFPSTQQAMMKTLQNETLVESLSTNGAPIEVRADLIPDPSTPSGYKWSSSSGPPVTVETGTLCSANVSVVNQRPISLMLPWLKEKVLGVGETAEGS